MPQNTCLIDATGIAAALLVFRGLCAVSAGPGPARLTTPPAAMNASRAFYVSSVGSDELPCSLARRPQFPKRTITSAAACLAPGDTLYLRAGTYAETLDDAIPSGVSWSNPVTVAAYPGELVTIKPRGGQFVFQTTASSYVVLDGLVLDGTNVTSDVVQITYGEGAHYAHHIRIRNCEIKNGPATGVGIHQGDTAHRTDHNEFINLSVHDNGRTDFHHGFYVESSHNLIDNSDVYNNSGWGLQAYTGVPGAPIDGNVVRNSNFHDNARSGVRGVGIGLYNGVANVAYNNVVYNNSGGIAADYGAVGTIILNNTVVANNRGREGWGIYNGDETDGGRRGSIRARIANNIANANRTNFLNSRADANVARNLFSGDPQFVAPRTADFHVNAASPAVDAGTNTGPIVIQDKDGVARPRGAAYDIGAYER